jgi:hypothetical protein
MLNDRPAPPTDIGAEMALLGAALIAPDVAGPALLTIAADDWHLPRHELIARTIAERLVRGEPVDPQLVLRAVMGLHDAGMDIGPYLHTLMDRAIVAAHAPVYAERIRAVAGARHLTNTCINAVQKIDEVTRHGDDLDLSTYAAGLITQIGDIADRSAAVDAIQVPTVLDLLATDETYDWVVPWLLERGERLFLTGSEGGGKSVLITQMIACFVAGLHPFTRTPIPPTRGFVVDCENPARLARRRYRDIVDQLDSLVSSLGLAATDWTNLHVEFRPDGLNLLDGRDVAWLESHVAATAPDVLVLGPLYKLHQTNINDEQAARQVTAVIDGIRHRHGCALITEAHAGNSEDANGRRNMRPRGSSLFRAWPEFGYGLIRSPDAADDTTGHPNIVDMIAWRGGREERDWPDELHHGTTLPWVPDLSYRPVQREAS